MLSPVHWDHLLLPALWRCCTRTIRQASSHSNSPLPAVKRKKHLRRYVRGSPVRRCKREWLHGRGKEMMMPWEAPLKDFSLTRQYPVNIYGRERDQPRNRPLLLPVEAAGTAYDLAQPLPDTQPESGPLCASCLLRGSHTAALAYLPAYIHGQNTFRPGATAPAKAACPRLRPPQ